MNLEGGLSFTPGGSGMPLDGLVDFLVRRPPLSFVAVPCDACTPEAWLALWASCGRNGWDWEALSSFGGSLAESGRTLLSCCRESRRPYLKVIVLG